VRHRIRCAVELWWETGNVAACAGQVQPPARRIAGSENIGRFVSDLRCCTSPVQAARPRRAPTTCDGSTTLVETRERVVEPIYFRAAENSNVAEQERTEVYKGLRICSSRSDSAAHHEKPQVCHLAKPAQIACAECGPGCARASQLRAQKSTCGGDQPQHQLRAERRHVQLARSSCSASVVACLSRDRLRGRQSVRMRRMKVEAHS
jgi:hypothetical protein